MTSLAQAETTSCRELATNQEGDLHWPRFDSHTVTSAPGPPPHWKETTWGAGRSSARDSLEP